ncbi:MAG: hypothetical protein CVU05_15585 [Bacteroidetes bacterium HGW-Bacteroidetes-21]|jgi:hypothetical protein|nr:MAG: hypothetical protein CVU05_15585 [Bacteroidetes bacterium HGW-Bacteroidetes-21]
MKRIFATFLFVGLLINLSAQKTDYPEISLPLDADSKLITYSQVVEAQANKDSLYAKSLAWFNAYFKNPTGVIREKSPENGQIMGKHQIKVLNPPDKKGIQTMKGIVQYTVKVSVKENKTRIILTDFNIRDNSYTPIEKWSDKSSVQFNNVNYYYLEQIDKEAKELVKNFQEFMIKATTVKKDEW